MKAGRDASATTGDREVMLFRSKTLIGSISAVLGLLAAGSASAELGVNFPEPAAGVAQEIFDIHMMTMGIATVLLIIVFAVVIYSLYTHRNSKCY